MFPVHTMTTENDMRLLCLIHLSAADQVEQLTYRCGRDARGLVAVHVEVLAGLRATQVGYRPHADPGGACAEADLSYTGCFHVGRQRCRETSANSVDSARGDK